MSQDKIAEVIGITAVHVNRTLQELRAKGMIANSGRRIEIPDWEQLCRLAEFDSTYLLLDRKIRLPA